MGRSILLAGYLSLSWLAEGPARRWVNRRAARGKEDSRRLPERFGEASLPRPEGQLLWFHAASVGESLSLLALIELALKKRPDLHVLVTTGTVTSARVMAERLPPRAFHQFVPVDTPSAIRRFLDHWRPDAAIWTESELWPRLVVDTHARGIPMLLINARLSARSARRLAWARGYAASLFNRFEAILAQDDLGANRLYALGASPNRLVVTGSLKDTAEPLPHDPAQLKKLLGQVQGRSVWLAASTHPGEEEIVSAAHRHARKRYHGLLLILVPRHPERGPELAQRLTAEGWDVALRSRGEEPGRTCDIYLADTLGEMGLWYRAAPIAFIGGSLVEIGGHNPFEPALLGSAILYGPHVENFRTAYDRFAKANAAVMVPDGDALAERLVEYLPPDRAAALANAAWAVSSEGADVTRQVWGVLAKHLPGSQA